MIKRVGQNKRWFMKNILLTYFLPYFASLWQMPFSTYFHEYLKGYVPPIINQVKSKIKILYLSLVFPACGKECTYTRTALLPFPCQHEENVLTCTGVCVSACVYWLMPSRAVAWLKHLLTIKLSCPWWSRRVILCITPVPLAPHADTQSNRKMGIFVFLALRRLVWRVVYLCMCVCVNLHSYVCSRTKDRKITRERCIAG